jgi:uncharacterized repeat protein (TIGR04052 family)
MTQTKWLFFGPSVPRVWTRRIIVCSALAFIGISACSERKDSVQVQFRPAFGDAPANMMSDLRFYVHDVELLDSHGGFEPLVLIPDGRWQDDTVALVDLAGPEINEAIRGQAQAAHKFFGIRFTIGVPFAKNHANPLTAAAPLNQGDLFWSWQTGYKSLRADLSTDIGAWSFHLGSTGCASASAVRAPSAPCVQPNHMRIELSGFDPTRAPIEVHVDELFASMKASGAGACTGAYATDPACGDIFRKTGLRIEDGECEDACRQQVLFSVP